MAATPDQTDDSRDLAAMGYKPVLNRTLGGFSAFAAGFSYISILTGVFQMFYVGYGAGGPAFFWTWPAVFLGQLTVALCFAELAARYPLSGGVYQWSRRTGGRAVGWMAGWIYLCGSVLSLAAVALALQGSLPQISPAFQFIGDARVQADSARNAVVLGCALIVATTMINVAGVRLLARINNAGVTAELIGVVLLIGVLFAHARRGPAILLDSLGRGDGGSWGYLGPALVAALMASYVLYGFDTAGTLAEETSHPRRRAPRAILQALAAAALAGALLIVSAILAVSDPSHPDLGRIAGGLPMLVKDVLGPRLGTLFLIDVVFAVFVLRPGCPRRHRPAHLLDGAGQQPAVCPGAGTRPAADAGPGAAGAVVVGAGRGAPRLPHQRATRVRDPLLGSDRLGEPGLLDGDVADADRPAAATVEAGASGSGRRRPAVLDGPARPADQRHRFGLGPVHRAEHLLAAPGDLRAGPLGPVRGPVLDAGLARRGRRLLRDRSAPAGRRDLAGASAGATG